MPNVEVKTMTSLTDISELGTMSVLIQEYVELNGKKSVLSNFRRALVPGEFEQAESILPENLYKVVLDLWTPAVVEAFNDNFAAQEGAESGEVPSQEG